MFKNEEGFSLLELVVAVGVAGIIAIVALPVFAGLQDKATTTGAEYAASASAAEARANQAIDAWSNSVLSSASSAYSNPISVMVSGSDWTNGTSRHIQVDGNVRNTYELASVGTTGYYEAYQNFAFPITKTDQGSITVEGLSSAKLNEIVTALNSGATQVTLTKTNGYVPGVSDNTITWNILSRVYLDGYGAWTNPYEVKYGNYRDAGADGSGGYKITIFTSYVGQSSSVNNYLLDVTLEIK